MTGKTRAFVIDFGGVAAQINNKKVSSRTHVDGKFYHTKHVRKQSTTISSLTGAK